MHWFLSKEPCFAWILIWIFYSRKATGTSEKRAPSSSVVEKDEKRGNLAGDWGGPFPLVGPSFAEFFFFAPIIRLFSPPRLVYSTPPSIKDFELEEYDFWRNAVKSLFPQQIEKIERYDIWLFLKCAKILLKTQFSLHNPSLCQQSILRHASFTLPSILFWLCRLIQTLSRIPRSWRSQFFRRITSVCY